MSLIEQSAAEADLQVIGAIDRGLDRVGPNVKYLVYWHLHNIGHVKRNEIVSNPERFLAALRGLYRESSVAVERAIIQELNISFGLKHSPTQMTAAINEARRMSEKVRIA